MHPKFCYSLCYNYLRICLVALSEIHHIIETRKASKESDHLMFTSLEWSYEYYMQKKVIWKKGAIIQTGKASKESNVHIVGMSYQYYMRKEVIWGKKKKEGEGDKAKFVGWDHDNYGTMMRYQTGVHFKALHKGEWWMFLSRSSP